MAPCTRTTSCSSSFPDIVNKEFTADMETRLDDIEAGKLDWHKVIGDFYDPFELELEEAQKTLEKVKIEDEVSDVPCAQCGALMVYKRGRFGRFLACPRFPECRYTQALLTFIEAPCPKCGSRLVERINRKGRKDIYEQPAEFKSAFEPKVYESLMRARSEEPPDEVADQLEKRGVIAITRMGNAYPPRLEHISDPPPTLFVLGSPCLELDRPLEVPTRL